MRGFVRATRVWAVLLLSLVVFAGYASAELPRVASVSELPTVRTHERSVIPFRVELAPNEDVVFEAISDNEGVLKVIGPARVLADQSIGFVRVESFEAGQTEITLGDQSFDVAVTARTAGGRLEARRPRIVSPVTGAALWGETAVSVEVFDDLGRLSEAGDEVSLRLPDGTSLRPISASPLNQGPHRRFTFEIDPSSWSAEPYISATLVAEVNGVAGIPKQSQPVYVGVYEPAAIDFLIDQEAEADPDVRRPSRAGGKRPLPVDRDANASAG
ncbi:MAG: hypothetical protein AAF663_04965, partial [Planctomycetota bacterium]